MKILQIHNYYQNKGGEDVVVNAEKTQLENNGHRVIQYLRHNDEIKRYRGSSLGLFFNAQWSVSSYKQVRAIVENERPDVAHFHNTLPLISPAAYYACQRAHVPVVQTLHNYRLICPVGLLFRDGLICEQCPKYSLARSVLYGCYRNSRIQTFTVALMLAIHKRMGTWRKQVDAYIALTAFMKERFVAQGFSEKKIVIKPNSPQKPLTTGASNTGIAGVYFGRLSLEKGLFTLLNAFEIVPQGKLIIAGDGSLDQSLKDFVRNKKMANVEFTGHLSGRHLSDLIRNASFIINSSECYEGFPVSIVEAFSAAKPVIASRVGAMSEIITHGETGLLYTPGSFEDLAVKLRWALTHKNEMRKMGQTARNVYENKYTPQANYKQLMGIYQSVAGTKDK